MKFCCGDESEQCQEKSTELAHGIKSNGRDPDAPLHATSKATGVGMREGKRLVTDGPFAETHEQVGC